MISGLLVVLLAAATAAAATTTTTTTRANTSNLTGNQTLIGDGPEVPIAIPSSSSSLSGAAHAAAAATANPAFDGQYPNASAPIANDRQQAKLIYTNQFVIQVRGGEAEARKLAEKHGFIYLNHILDDYYHLEHRRISKRSTSSSIDVNAFDAISMRDEPEVLLLERQVLKKRVKRDFLEFVDHQQLQLQQQHQHQQQQQSNQRQALLRPANQPARQQHLLHLQQLQPNRRPAAGPQHAYTRPANQPARPFGLNPSLLRLGQLKAAATSSPLSEQLEAAGSSPAGQHQLPAGRVWPATLNGSLAASSGSLAASGSLSSLAAYAHHPQYSQAIANGAANNQSLPPSANQSSSKQVPFNDPSWPLMWYLDGGAKNGFDLNVMAAWKMGYTGKGIVITILDDGLEKDHPDLQANYDPLASFDINGDDADPMPRYDPNDSNRHGTRCAGEVAAVPDNNICSIGIAYNSKVGGVRMLDGDVTDAVEARSLGLNNQHIHIYSASWGPDDNGKTVDGPGELATRAFIEGVTNGRQGLGSIFVFASGNGGREHDNCNCDGYTNSIWTLSISSATENGFVPWYIEACSSTLATTYSSGSYEERQIATTDLHHSCTSSHTGTSASAPLAAGICALVLESNPMLSWRDMQHIVVRTAKPANLVAKDWRTNGLGRNVSHAFGYGLMDAAAMIKLARKWTTVPAQFTCQMTTPPMDKYIPSKGFIELKLEANCSRVRYLEHVQSKVTLSANRRGDIHIYLVSPHGTRSTLLAQRPNDQAEQGFRNWPFMTVHSWGESPHGKWTLEVHNDGKAQSRAFLKEWTLIMYGTSEDPNKHLDAPVQPQQPPPPPAPPSPAPVQVQPAISTQRPPTGAPVKSPVSAPPPPIPPISGNGFPGTEPDPTSAAPAQTGRPHWSSYPPTAITSPPPPPLPPLPPMGRPSGSQQQVHPTTTSASASTSTSSYVTTFKTIVSSTSSPPPPPLNGRFKTLPVSEPSQPAKADFEIVSPTGQLDRLHPISAQTEQPIMKPPVGQEQQQPTLPPLQAVDNNQLELKLSKDYRSSGDQTKTTKTSSDGIMSSETQTPQIAHRPSNSAPSQNGPAPISCLLLMAITFGQLAYLEHFHLLTNQLVRAQ